MHLLTSHRASTLIASFPWSTGSSFFLLFISDRASPLANSGLELVILLILLPEYWAASTYLVDSYVLQAMSLTGGRKMRASIQGWGDDPASVLEPIRPFV